MLISCAEWLERHVPGVQGSDEPVWRYIDPQGIMQGPFPADKMVQWYNAGYLMNPALRMCGHVRLPGLLSCSCRPCCCYLEMCNDTCRGICAMWCSCINPASAVGSGGHGWLLLDTSEINAWRHILYSILLRLPGLLTCTQ